MPKTVTDELTLMCFVNTLVEFMKSKVLLSCVCVCVALLAACGKKHGEGAGGTSGKKTDASGGASEPAELPPATTPTLVGLNLLVTDFYAQYRRAPDNLDELVQKKLVPRLPEPPAGKRWLLTKDKAGRPQVTEAAN